MKEKKSREFRETGAKEQELGCPGHPPHGSTVSPFHPQAIFSTINKQIPKRLFSIKDASLYLGRSPWTVAEMIRTGKLPYISDGKRRFLDIHDINNWIEKSKRKDDER